MKKPKELYSYLFILLGVLILFLPILIRPAVFLARDNDLTEFFWPIYYFVKDQILNHRVFPLWNNLFLSGTPLLPDPQSPLFYLPNIIFLFLPMDFSFVFSTILHIFAGGAGMYLLSKNGFNFSKKASLISAFIYIFAPRLAGYITAGHFGLIQSWAWVPFVFFAILKIVKKKKMKWSVLLGISMCALFYTHVFNFLIISFATVVFFLVANYFLNKKPSKETLLYYTLAALIAFGLSAVTLIPQYIWKDYTTRTLLINKPQIFPIWSSKLEFIKAAVTPWMIDEGLGNIVTEKWIALGICALLVSIIALIKINKKVLIPLLLSSLFILLIALGNASPIYSLLIKMDWFKTMRVPTRVWVVFLLAIPLLAAYAVDRYKKWFVTLLSIGIVIESLIFSWIHIHKPASSKTTIPEEVYSIITQDKDNFRVLCLHRCISQKEAAIRNIELIDGYSTLTQLNYFQHSWQLTGGYWDYYALPTPPTGVYLFQDLQPNPKSLAEYGTKYILSNHKLNDSEFNLLDKFEDIFLYKLNSFTPRDYQIYTPNVIAVSSTKADHVAQQVVIPEVYSPGWKAYLNGTDETVVQETPSALRSVKINQDTDFVLFKYSPPGYKLGAGISLTTLVLLCVYPLLKKRMKNLGLPHNKV